MSKLSVNIDTALFNAGILGFIKVLDAGGIKHDENGGELSVNSEDLLGADLADLFIKCVVEKYKKDTELYRALHGDDMKKLAAAFSRPSISTGLRICNYGGYDCLFDTIKEVKNGKDKITYKWKDNAANDDINNLKSAIEQNAEIAEVLYLKGIAYTKLNMLWAGSTCFLNRNSADDDMKECFNKTFVHKLKQCLSDNERQRNSTANSRYNGHTKKCAQCGCDARETESISFMNGMGVDDTRKLSAFWNCNVDLRICPLCKFVYACAVLGFNQIKQDLIFVNASQDIESLRQANSKFEMESADADSNTRYLIVSKLIINEVAEKEKELDNIEVLIVKKKGFSLDIISKETIGIFKRCKEELGRIKKRNDLLDEILRYLFYNRALWSLMYEEVSKRRDKQGKNKPDIFAAWQMLYIQIKRKENKMEEEKNAIGRVYAASRAGETLRVEYENDKRNANKLGSFAIKLQNALRVDNREHFLDVVLRLYSGIGHEVPDILLKVLYSDDLFKEIGFAFVLGLYKEKKEKGEN